MTDHYGYRDCGSGCVCGPLHDLINDLLRGLHSAEAALARVRAALEEIRDQTAEPDSPSWLVARAALEGR